MKNFQDFTNLYELSKTLRFELKPIWGTKKLIEEKNILKLDKKKRENYEKVKPYFNKIHQEFINFALRNPNFDFSQFEEKYLNWLKDKKNKDLLKEKESIDKIFLEKIWKLFENSVKDFLKENGFESIVKSEDQNLKFFRRKEIFEVLQEKYGSELETQMVNKDWEIKSIFNGWEKWLWYFDKFFNTRDNFYKTDWTSTAIATRIIKDNLKIFLENIVAFGKIKNKKIDFSEVEKNFSVSIDTFFEINNFNNCFLQDWIDFYNKVIWGETLENWEKLKWLNEIINKYRQDTGEKIPYFKKLQKQILSEKDWVFIDKIEDDEGFYEVLKNFYKNAAEKEWFLKNIFENFYTISDKNLEKIYFNKIAFNTISHKFWSALEFERILYEEMKKEKADWIKFEKKENKYKFPDFIQIIFIKRSLENYDSENLFWKERYYKYEENVDWFLEKNNNNIWEQFCKILNFEFLNILKRRIIDEAWEEYEVWFEISKNILWEKLENFELNQENKWIIKDFADYSLALYSFWKYFAVEKWRNWDLNIDISDDFYGWEDWYIEKFYNTGYDEIVKPYNLMRNYISKKPWEDNKKWKINFETSSLLSGWDKNLESNWSYIFQKWNKYYLWIINWSKPAKEILEKLYSWDGEKIKRFIYDFQKPDNKNTPRMFIRSKKDSFSPAVEKYNLPVEDILEIYDNWLFKTDNKDNSNYKESLSKLIDYFKLGFSKHESFKHFNFVWKDSKSYENIADFYRDVEKSCYKIDFEFLNFEELKKLTFEKHLYLFQIYNKDFELDESLQEKWYNFKGEWQKNIHTKYFEALFLEENISRKSWAVFKLSWGWEVFFRKKSIKAKKEKRNSVEVIKNKRYTECKYFLHFPIQVNFKEEISWNFNQEINKFLANNPDINVIWIDRWEKHLAYFSVINQKWEILESWSFNKIENYNKNWEKLLFPEREIKEIHKDWSLIDLELVETWRKVDYVDYKLLLEYKERKRLLQRQSWKEVEQIKDLKKWYISALVRKIADLIIKHNAIVIFEDLNFRFKQIRGWIEKSIYQQLEKALIDKLNFLVNKNEINLEKAGSILKAYQLTVPVDSLKEIWKQTWVIFYTEAAYTSKIDPITGWRPNLYLKKNNSKINKENILKFDNIVFNSKENRFEFTYDLKKFFWKDSKFPAKTVNTVCSCVERFKWNRNLNNNKWGYIHYENLTDWKLANKEQKEDEFSNFKELFEKYFIDINWNILEQIKNLDTKNNEKFFSSFIDLFTLVCQIRNTNQNAKWDENDFILSPVEPFFDSRKSQNFWKSLPKNWDENWAFNIARKGLIILNRISENPEKPDLLIFNADWDNFARNI